MLRKRKGMMLSQNTIRFVEALAEREGICFSRAVDKCVGIAQAKMQRRTKRLIRKLA